MGRVEQMMQARGLNVSGSLSAPANAASKAKVQALHEEQALKTASNTAAAPAAPVSKATTSRGWVSLDPERGYSPGGERARRQYVSLPEPRKTETAPVDYRRAVELNRMEGDLNRAWRQNAASRSPDEPPDYSRMPSSRLAVLRNQAQIDLDTDTLNRINQVLKTRRAARGQQTAGDRVGDMVGTVSARTVGAVANTVGAVSNAFSDPESCRRQIAAMQKQLENGGYSDGVRFHPLTEEGRKTLQDRIRLLADKAWQLERPDSFTNRAYRLADQAREDAARYTGQAKEGLGELGQLAVDVGIAGGQMGLDALTAALLGPAAVKVLMGGRSFGDAAQEARLAGADLDRQLLSGLGSAGITLGTNQLSNFAKPFQKIYGKGLAETVAGRLASRFGDSTAVQIITRLSQTAAGRIALSALGEAGEENLEGYLQAAWDRFVYNPEARYTAEEARRDALVAGILGALGGVPEAIGNIGSKPARNQAGTGTGAEAQAAVGMDAAQVQTGAQGVQAAPVGDKYYGHTVSEIQDIKIEPPTRTSSPEAPAVQPENTGGSIGDMSAPSADPTIAQGADSVKSRRTDSRAGTVREYHGQILDTVRKTLDKIRDMEPVAQLTGSEFQKTTGDNRNLRQKVIDFFNGLGNKVNRPGMGEIELNAAGARDSTAHGYGRLKAATFAALPSVLERGRLVESRRPYEGHNYDSYIISAPVEVNGTTCYVGALVIKDANMQRYKLHEVLTTDENGVPLFKSESTGQTDGPLRSDTPFEEPGGSSTTDSTIPQRADSVKTDPLVDAIFSTTKRVDQAALTPEQFDRLASLNERGAVGMDAAGRVYQVDPTEHIDRRSMESVGEKRLNAFSFDHPELHNYFKRAAEALIADADLSMQFPAVRRYEQGPQGRRVVQGAEVSAHLRQAMDETGLSRAQLIDAAKRIVADHGQENQAAAKRVEIILDSMLENGWTAMTGKSVPPSREYIDAKRRIVGSGAAGAQESYIPPDLDAAGGDGLGAADAGSVNSDYDRLQAQSDAFHPINESSAQRIMEEQHRAPSEVPTHTENGASIYKTVSTILNSPLTSPEMAVEIERAVADGSFDYIPVTDSDAMRRAQADLSNRGLQRVAGEFQTKVDLGQRITKNDMAAAIAAYNQAVADGDHTTAFDLMVAMSDTAHDSAQVVQTMNLMNRLTPEGRLLTLRRFVDKMNRRQNRRPGGTGEKSSASTDAARGEFVEQSTGFRISDELATNYLMAETDAERAAAWDAITTDIAKQIPSTFMDKANFWRYTSMLLNPTTHVRNTAGNLIQAGARTIKNGVGAAIERAVIQNQAQRTKSILTGKEGKDLKEFARGQYAADQDAAMGAGKYSDASAAGIEREIQSKRKAFNGDDVFSKGVQAVGDLNSNLLDMEDLVFNRSAYVSSFAQALKAKGVTAAEAASGSKADLVEAARVYAIEEARRATYRNTTALSEYLSEKGRYQGDNVVKKAASFAANAFLPFRRTPANILTTGMDYSPLGILKAVKQGTIDLKRGDCTAADVVDSLCAGLTGSGIMAVGMYLAAEGLLRVRAGDDDREETYNKDRGIQDYSLQIGNRSYTLDWAVPAAMPLFAGAAVMEAWQDDVNGFEAVLDAMGGISQVVLETSMLSSLNNLISNWSYADNKGLYLLDRTATGYAGQYVPTIGGKIASAADDTVRRSYVEKNTGQMASDADYFLQSILKKIPGARNALQPKIDLWGEDVSNGTIGDRLVQSFISPGYLKTVDTGKLDQELRRLEEAVGRSSVYPSEAAKSFRLKDGSTKYLTAEEYTQYARKVGQTRKEILGDLIGRKGYQAMNDEEKAYVVDMVYDYAAKTAQRGLVGDKVEPSKWILEAMQSPLPPADVILYRARANQLEDNEKVREEIFRDGGLSSNEKNLLDDLILSDGFYITRDRNVDYSDRDSFAVSQMSDAAFRHWGLIKDVDGMTAERYGTAWEIFNRKGTKGAPYNKERKLQDLQNELGISRRDAARLYELMGAEVE